MRWITGFLAILVSALEVLPFLGLIGQTPWSQLALDGGDRSALWTSLSLSLLAALAILVLGTPLAFALARWRGPGRGILEGLIWLALLTPPLALGILLSLIYGQYGWVGNPLSRLGVNLTNTPLAFWLAELYSGLPYYLLAARGAFEGVPTRLEEAARLLGESPGWVFLRVSLPLVWPNLLASLAIAWARAMGEFGSVLIIAYYPQGVPVHLWVNLEDYGVGAVYSLLWAFLALTLPLPLLLILSRKRAPRYGL